MSSNTITGIRKAARFLLLSLLFVGAMAERAMADDVMVLTSPTAADFIRALTPPTAGGDAQSDVTAFGGENSRAMANNVVVLTNPTAADFIRALTPPTGGGEKSHVPQDPD